MADYREKGISHPFACTFTFVLPLLLALALVLAVALVLALALEADLLRFAHSA